LKLIFGRLTTVNILEAIFLPQTESVHTTKAPINWEKKWNFFVGVSEKNQQTKNKETAEHENYTCVYLLILLKLMLIVTF
jgi:hypothetical protein